MSIKSANITLYIMIIGVLFSSHSFAQHAPIWPIRPNIANWNQVNCTFGEIHGDPGDHFHGAIDIDEDQNQVPAPSASVVQPGKVIDTFPSFPGTGVIVAHEYPPNSGRFERQTQYLHLTGNIPALNDKVGTGDSIGLMGNHLHFVMEELVNGEWVRLNPLDKDSAWNLRYHQHLENRPDTYDPQVNDIIVEAKTGCTAPPAPGQACLQNNGVASGFDVYTTAGGLVKFNVDATQYVRAHMADVSPDSGDTNCNYSILGVRWNGPLFDYPNDQLVVYGNIGMTARVRDVAINSAPGHETSSGCGLTIRHLDYRIENDVYNIRIPSKYPLSFDRLKENERNQVGQIFANATFDANHIKYGNNDFIELRSGDDTYLSPYPNALVGQVQSNGIWFTKARGDTEDVFQYTPDADHVAKCNIGNFSDNPLRPEAKYPDGEYTLKFFAQDDFGRVNRDLTSGWDVNAQLKFIVDNFLPFVEQVDITSGEALIYAARWNWNALASTLELLPQDPLLRRFGNANRNKNLLITVKTSEPMQLVGFT